MGKTLGNISDFFFFTAGARSDQIYRRALEGAVDAVWRSPRKTLLLSHHGRYLV
jgi:hypothetical protein